MRKMSKTLMLFLVALSVAQAQKRGEDSENCPRSDVTFEMMTGYVFTSPDQILDTRPDSLKLSDCIDTCRANDSCRALNFETGLCVLFKTSATVAPGQFNFITFTYLHDTRVQMLQRSWQCLMTHLMFMFRHFCVDRVIDT